MASRLPSIGRHSFGDLMNCSLSWLIVPSRSRMTSFTASPPSFCELRQVGDPVHGCVQYAKEPDAVIAHPDILVHHHHLVEKRVHGRLERSERFERPGVLEVAVS